MGIAQRVGIARMARAVQDVAVDRTPRTRSAAGVLALVAFIATGLAVDQFSARYPAPAN
jgi:hypothetical protein